MYTNAIGANQSFQGRYGKVNNNNNTKNATPAFQGEKPKEGDVVISKDGARSLRNSALAMLAALGTMSVAPSLTSCTEDLGRTINNEINTNIFTNIMVKIACDHGPSEPGKPDTVYITIPSKPDTIYMPGKTDTIHLPGKDSIVYIPGKDSIVYLPGKNDTIHIPGKTDTLYLPGKDSIIYKDSIIEKIIYRDSIVYRTDTLEVPGDPYPVYIKPGYKPEVEDAEHEWIGTITGKEPPKGVIYESSYYNEWRGASVTSTLMGKHSSFKEKVYCDKMDTGHGIEYAIRRVSLAADGSVFERVYKPLDPGQRPDFNEDVNAFPVSETKYHTDGRVESVKYNDEGGGFVSKTILTGKMTRKNDSTCTVEYDYSSTGQGIGKFDISFIKVSTVDGKEIDLGLDYSESELAEAESPSNYKNANYKSSNWEYDMKKGPNLYRDELA